MHDGLFPSHVLLLQGVSVGTIKTKANVCCVQFPLDFAHFLAFGSADHQIYYYDLRNLKVPLCAMVGHDKTVSYIKFVDTMSLVSASTDNTLKHEGYVLRCSTLFRNVVKLLLENLKILLL